jgi:hypothetical protein
MFKVVAVVDVSLSSNVETVSKLTCAVFLVSAAIAVR